MATQKSGVGGGGGASYGRGLGDLGGDYSFLSKGNTSSSLITLPAEVQGMYGGRATATPQQVMARGLSAKPGGTGPVAGSNSQWAQETQARNEAVQASGQDDTRDSSGPYASADEGPRSPSQISGAVGQVVDPLMRKEAHAAELEAQLSLQEAKLRNDFFQQLQSVNKQLADIGPSQELFKNVEKRINELMTNPDSVLESTAYKQFEEHTARTLQRKLNAQGYDISGGFGASILAQTMAQSRQQYTNQMRQWLTDLMGLGVPLKGQGLQNLQQTNLAYADANPWGQALGSMANYARASAYAGQGTNAPALSGMLSQMKSGLPDLSKLLS